MDDGKKDLNGNNPKGGILPLHGYIDLCIRKFYSQHPDGTKIIRDIPIYNRSKSFNDDVRIPLKLFNINNRYLFEAWVNNRWSIIQIVNKGVGDRPTVYGDPNTYIAKYWWDIVGNDIWNNCIAYNGDLASCAELFRQLYHIFSSEKEKREAVVIITEDFKVLASGHSDPKLNISWEAFKAGYTYYSLLTAISNLEVIFTDITWQSVNNILSIWKDVINHPHLKLPENDNE